MAGERWMVLVHPGFPIETKWAYDRLASTRSQVLSIGEQLKKIEVDQAISWDRLTGLMENDFETAIFPVFPELEKIKEELKKGTYPTREMIEEAASQLALRWARKESGIEE